MNDRNGDAQFQDPPSGSPEDRQEDRVGVDLNVTVNSDHNFYAGHAQNLSEGGIFIATHIVHPIGTMFDLSLHVDDGQTGVVRGKGEVRWIRPATDDLSLPAGLGIKFTELEGDGAERIAAFLQTRAPIAYDEPDAYPDEEGFDDEPTAMVPPPGTPRGDPASAPRMAPRPALEEGIADEVSFADEPTTAIQVGDPSGSVLVDDESVEIQVDLDD